uniref:Ankyrin repeat and ubiquitin domain containing 1 n=1 Tax=Mastacembelus armatus TaxID=205130 RepID=A0A3Q3RHF7_9TELE
MRIFIYFEGSCELFDVSPTQTVRAMKQIKRQHFPLSRYFLELTYGGATLQDSWALCDVGINSGSAIRCLIKSEQNPVIHVFNAVTGETIPVMGSETLLHMSVAGLKTLVSMQCGLPVSAFRLSSLAGVQLYDCNQLQHYGTAVGATLRLDSWDGWVDFLHGCLLGHKFLYMNKRLRVALYIAAFLGHLDLADWLLERGVHAEEPVGVHPYRQWCHQTAHQDTGKCPIHVAAENNQLLILKLFVTKKPLTLACQDFGGRDPLKITIQHGHRDCVRYLANKMCSVVSLPNISLPMRIYLQMQRWMSLGQKRVSSVKCQYGGDSLKAWVVDMLLVDGFSQSKMSSKCRKADIEPRGGIRAKALQPLPPISNLLSLSHLPFKRTPHQKRHIFQPVNPSDFKEMQKRHKLDRKEERLNKINEGDKRGTSTLPPITMGNLSRPVFVGASPKPSKILTASLKSSHHCGHTPSENAIYCLSIASTFTEKPWFKQLSIARTLIRKCVPSRIPPTWTGPFQISSLSA